ncbi:hypothetical protein A1O7_01209 [Cladophialophora yegresii CBS 114405]|uniref:Phytanoyl-CoA dioxygenase n=1 Tax=Cladophialophora yegresii CBS 114405 TaxID=1182544 RepID=W9WIT7_9EURO|nr:uncharacterized protein A1O7_01209 [Cladophialophora yegresii CBS 114405]EXJ64870.1 hypothetical protein A1O7_01209 [Cladophialophora yegresii CBS 114405]
MPGKIEEWTDYKLTEEQKQHWMDHGFVKIEGCFSRDFADRWTSSIWTRLGADPNDKSTWPTEKLNMPGHTVVSVKEHAPKAYAAMCELVGGEERVADWCKNWKDGWIPNLGKPEYKPTDELDFRALDNWHCDGDWFTHYLDSPEQALLVIPLFTEIKPKGGGTAICTDGIKLVAKRLHDLPQGATPYLAERGTPEIPKSNPRRRELWNSWVRDPQLTRDESFHEATGQVGDVYFLHPFMLHSASKNLRREVRIITNPPVALKEPFNYNRADGRYSLVEAKTLKDLGRPEGLPDWTITGPRELLSAAGGRIQMQEEMKKKELERLKIAGIPIHTLEGLSEYKLDYYPS